MKNDAFWTNLKRLIDRWDFVVTHDTQAYGYEIFVQMSDAMIGNAMANHADILASPSKLVQAIGKGVREMGNTNPVLFKEIWDEYRSQAA